MLGGENREELIERAIREKKLVHFDYHGFNRIAEPHVYGITNRIKQFLGYQVDGGSSRGGIPDWRRFDLHEIKNLQVLEKTFPGKRPFPSGKHSHWGYQIAVVE
ncbi:MAG: hypothetical protein KAT65_05495 [Methanophagales archaeon]|jgi:predicted DNA-binding transcriptional regulator YafY|nr:hypothetical protein [Methanophagales archaeon]